jgi:hypothetical protein
VTLPFLARSGTAGRAEPRESGVRVIAFETLRRERRCCAS